VHPWKARQGFYFPAIAGKRNSGISDRLRTRPVYDAVEELMRVFYPDATADPYLQFFLDKSSEIFTETFFQRIGFP